jgi:hypothetical protein
VEELWPQQRHECHDPGSPAKARSLAFLILVDIHYKTDEDLLYLWKVLESFIVIASKRYQAKEQTHLAPDLKRGGFVILP